MSSNVELLVDSCNFNVLNVVINGIEIRPNYIQDLAIDWYEFEIYGYMTINDHYDIVNTGLDKPGQKMTITYIDNFDAFFSREFVITLSSETKEQDFKGVKLNFQDVVSFRLQNTFKSKSYARTSLDQIFLDYMALEVNEEIDGFPIEVKTQTTRTLTNFVVPGNVSFLSFIKSELNKEGVYFYQTKAQILLGSYSVDETPEVPYKQVGGKDNYGFNIIEYNLYFNNIKETNEVPKFENYVFDKSTKSMKVYSKSLEDFMDDMNLGGVVQNSQLTNGTQFKTKEYLLDTNKFQSRIYKSNTELEIIVPGNIEYNILWKLVNVELSGAVYTTETRENGDLKLSGKYQIKRVEDKFLVGQKFVQKLTLRRINEGKQ